MNPRPFFIVGSGRSGTTLLRAMLNANKSVHIPHESEFVAASYQAYGNTRNLDDQAYRHLVELFLGTSRGDGWGLPRSALLSSLCAERPKNVAAVNDLIYSMDAAHSGRSNAQWGIKSPVLIASIPGIRAVFPDAKIVHMLRDGRDVYLSYRAVHARDDVARFGPRTALQAALYWVDGLRRVDEFREASSEDLIELRYEDLLVNTERELRRLCTFLDVVPDAAMWSQHHDRTTHSPLSDEERRTIHSKVDEPLDATNIAKWREGMSRRDLAVFEAVARPYLLRYGYASTKGNGFNILTSMPRALLLRGARLYNNHRYQRRSTFIIHRAGEAARHEP